MTSKDKKIDVLLKFLVVGDEGVGKTSIILRYVHEIYTPEKTSTTIGLDFKVKIIDLESKKIKLQIWDTAGKDKFQTQTTSYYSGAHVIMLMYDVTKRSTFANIRNWITQIRMHSDHNVIIILIGAKTDQEGKRAVTYEEGDELAAELKISFFECSACNNINIEECFIHGVEEYLMVLQAVAEAAVAKSARPRSSRTMEALLASADAASRETFSRNTVARNSLHQSHAFFSSTEFKKQEFEFMVQFQKSAPHITLSGVSSWRKNVINGVYKPEKGELSPKFTNIDNNSISLILFQCTWYLKVKSKIVCKIWCYNNLLSMPFIAKSENNYWYEKMGVFLPIYRARKNIRCEICTNVPEPKKGKHSPTPGASSNSGSTAAESREGRTSICLRSSLVNNKPFMSAIGGGNGNDDEFEEDNFTFSHYLEYETLPISLGLSIVLYIQFLVVKIALLELDFKNNSSNTNINKGTIEEIKLRYRDLVSNLNTSIMLHPPTPGEEYCCAPLTLIDISSGGNTLKQHLCDVLQYIIIDSNNLLTILSQHVDHTTVATRCQLTADQVKETLKLLLLSDMSLKADKIEWIVDEEEEEALVRSAEDTGLAARKHANSHESDSDSVDKVHVGVAGTMKTVNPAARQKRLSMKPVDSDDDDDNEDDAEAFHSTVERETFTIDEKLDTSLMVSNSALPDAGADSFKRDCDEFVDKVVALIDQLRSSEQAQLPSALVNSVVQPPCNTLLLQALFIFSKANKKFEDSSTASSGGGGGSANLSLNTVINTLNSMYQYLTMVIEDVLLTSPTLVRESVSANFTPLSAQFNKVVKYLTEENFSRHRGGSTTGSELDKISIVKSMISDTRVRLTTLQFK